MTTKFRTLWLLGLIGLCAPAAGCGEAHHHGWDDSGAGSCLANQFFEVQWGVDHGPGTLPLACADIRSMGSSVVVLTDAAPPYDQLPVSYGIRCDDRWTCPDGTPCNMDGTTASGVPAGTSIVEVDLIGANGAVLSAAVIDPRQTYLYAIDSCQYTVGPFPFTIAF
jgi:hypothetical protein